MIGQAPASSGARTFPGKEAWTRINALVDANRYSDALNEAKLAVSAQPDSGQLHYLFSRLLGSIEDVPGELAEATRAAALMPRAPDIHAQLADALRRSGDLPGARQSLTTALALDPKHPWALRQLFELDEIAWIRARGAKTGVEPGTPNQTAHDFLAAAERGDLAAAMRQYWDLSLIGSLLEQAGGGDGDAMLRGFVRGLETSMTGPSVGHFGGFAVSPESHDKGDHVEVNVFMLVSKVMGGAEVDRLRRMLTEPALAPWVSAEVRSVIVGLSPADREAYFLRMLGHSTEALVEATLLLRKQPGGWRIYDAVLGDARSIQIPLSDLIRNYDAVAGAMNLPRAPRRDRRDVAESIGKLVGIVIAMAFLLWLLPRLKRR